MTTTHYSGIIGFIIFVLDVFALVHVIGSQKSVLRKVFWVVIILLLPILGFILWAVFGPRADK